MKKFRFIAPLLIAALLFAACTPVDVEEPAPGMIDDTPGVIEPTPGMPGEAPEVTPEVTPEITPELETPEVEETDLPTDETPEVEETPAPGAGTAEATQPAGTPAASPGTGGEAAGPISQLSTLMDFEIADAQGERLGQVEDMIVDVSLEVVLYAVANLDEGGRTVAIPYNSMRIDRTQQNFPNTFQLSVDPEVLAMAPEIDPAMIDFSAEDWFVEYETFWDDPQAALSPEDTPEADETDEAEEADEGEETDEVEEPTPTPLPVDARVRAGAVLASNLLGAEVVHGSSLEVEGAGNETLGTLADVIVDPVSGRTQHLVVEAGEQMANIGEWIPVPLTQVLVSRLATDTAGEDLVVQLEEDRLAGAPSFEMGQLPDTNEPGWDAGVIEYWTLQ